MRERRTDSSDPGEPGHSGTESFEGSAPQPPADALEAARARARRVDELRRAVADGTYRPEGRKIAEALLRSRIRTALFGDDH